MKIWPSSSCTGDGEMTCLSMLDDSQSSVPSESASAEMPTILPHSAEYTYIFFPAIVIGVTDEWDIWSPFGLGVFQRTLPVSHSTPIRSTSLPQGARTAVVPSMIGHCAVYHSSFMLWVP